MTQQAEEPRLHKVTLWMCALCLDGAGGECHTPGCALWINRAPDLPIRTHPCVLSIDGVSAHGYVEPGSRWTDESGADWICSEVTVEGTVKLVRSHARRRVALELFEKVYKPVSEAG